MQKREKIFFHLMRARGKEIGNFQSHFHNEKKSEKLGKNDCQDLTREKNELFLII